MLVISTFRDHQFFNRCKVLGWWDDSEKRFKITLDPQSPSNSMFVISTFRDHQLFNRCKELGRGDDSEKRVKNDTRSSKLNKLNVRDFDLS